MCEWEWAINLVSAPGGETVSREGDKSPEAARSPGKRLVAYVSDLFVFPCRWLCPSPGCYLLVRAPLLCDPDLRPPAPSALRCQGCCRRLGLAIVALLYLGLDETN
eukprot:scaffold87089_cov32-Tisochrysis_lutea.AAC.2